MTLRALTLGLALLCVSGCGRAPDGDYEQQLFAFGTLVDINLYGVEPERARQAVQAVDDLFRQQHHDWHAWQRGELDDVNRALSEHRSVEADASIMHLIQLGQRFEILSGGLFNPAIGHLLKLWGFQQDEPGRTLPDTASIQRWLKAAPSTTQLHLSATRISSDNPSVKLDFGGFAKGYSVALAIQLLKQRGIQNMIVNAGGDLCLAGRHGDRPWRIGIRSPDGQGVLASLDLEGAQCVFTSGDYERYFEINGKRYSHIIDPRSGYPAVGTRSVTVLAADAALADAAATALFVAGPRQWRNVARRMGIREVLLIDAAGDAQMSKSLEALVHFEQPPKSVETVELSPPD